MRNYDPNNPTDLLGQPIREGDVVANSIASGSSSALRVCVIEKIRFTRKHPISFKNVECPQAQAEAYTLRVQPLAGDTWGTWTDTQTGKEVHQREVDHVNFPGRYRRKTVTVLLVKNVVKLGLTLPEAETLAYA